MTGSACHSTSADKPVSVIALPHGAFTNDQPPALPPPDPEVTEILVIHGQYKLSDRKELRGAKDNVDDDTRRAAYAYVALGHWHTFEKMGGNAWYSGSTERIGLTDKDCLPGYARVILHADGPEVTHVPLPARDPLVAPRPSGPMAWTADEIETRVVRALEMKEVAGKRADAMVVCRVENTPVGVDRDALRLLAGPRRGARLLGLSAADHGGARGGAADRGGKQHRAARRGVRYLRYPTRGGAGLHAHRRHGLPGKGTDAISPRQYRRREQTHVASC